MTSSHSPSPFSTLLAALRQSPRNAIIFSVSLIAGIILHLWMLAKFSEVTGDTLLYGNLATNILLHGRFAIADGSGVLHTTLIRLPGYPLFLALCFRIFGLANYRAVQYLQIFLNLSSSLLLADFVRRLTKSVGAALCTLALTAICPFTAVYAAAPLTEIPTLFLIALALWSMQCFAQLLESALYTRRSWVYALLFTFSITAAAMLRPDGALVGVALAPALFYTASKTLTFNFAGAALTAARGRLLRMGIICTLLALLPFALWTLRNWQRFHLFEPLAPRYATDPGESTNPGWQSWTKTWCLDFVSTYQIYWNVPDSPFDPTQLPSRAFDSPEQRTQTLALIADYNNQDHDLTPELDARFAQLAAERIQTHPLRYYLWLPLGRVADMWLRPRIENLPIDLDWWVYSHHYSETRISWSLVVLNTFYLVIGIIGLALKPRFGLAMLAYFLLRSALLATIEAPEARYTLECFPMLFALGGIALARICSRRKSIS
jgi:hypothetical protein